MTWASTDDVLEITGKTVSASAVAQANAVISIYCNRSPEASAGMGARDLYWLKQAAAWQAPWQAGQVGYEGRQSVGSFSQDGIAVDYDQEWQVSLAPLAARSLKNLSWKGVRTSRAIPFGAIVSASGVDFTLETSDELHGWSTLEGV